MSDVAVCPFLPDSFSHAPIRTSAALSEAGGLVLRLGFRMEAEGKELLRSVPVTYFYPSGL